MPDLLSPSNVWECSERVLQEFLARTRGEVELSCMAQIARLLRPLAVKGDTLLDAACGTAHLYNSLQLAGVPVRYYGIDKSRMLVHAARNVLKDKGLPAARIQALDILDCIRRHDHVVCVNTLEFLPHYHPYLDRLCRIARKSLILRTSLGEATSIQYLLDGCLDPPHNDLELNFNTYNLSEVRGFIEARGFATVLVKDAYTGDGPELVAGDKTMYRKLLVCERRSV